MPTFSGTNFSDVIFGTRNDDDIFGAGGDDILTGGDGFDAIYGGDGNDIMEGGANPDLLQGGPGSDIISGGTGSDTIYGDSRFQGGGGGSTADVTTANTTSIPSSGQSFSVSLTAPDASSDSSYTISGFVSTSAVTAPNVNVVLVTDISGSTSSGYSGTAVGDLNGDGWSDTVLDGEIAGGTALINSIIYNSNLPNANIGLVSFDSDARIDFQGIISQDANNNGVLDAVESLQSLSDQGLTNFEAALQQAINYLNGLNNGGQNYVFFLSDGVPVSSGDYSDESATLRDPNGLNATIRAFPIGSGASVIDLDLLDDGVQNGSAPTVSDPGNLSAAITGGGITAADVLEVQVYVNGVLEQIIPASALVSTPFGLRYQVDLTGLSTTAPEDIEVIAVASDGSRTTISTSQTVENLSNDGNDVIFGGSGSDDIYGEGGNDVAYGGEADDFIDGGAGDDTIGGGEGDDVLSGSGGNDEVWGMVGDDFAFGGEGDDTIGGGEGDDGVFGAGGNDVVYGGDGDDGVGGADGHDTLFGGNGDDGLFGGNGDDDMYGGTGNDDLWAGNGNDFLSGGFGRDSMAGGAGSDTFAFNLGDGNDLVRDFVDNVDTIQLDSALWGGGLSAAQVVSSFASVSGGDIVLNFGGGDTLTLDGFTNLSALADDISII